ncbi:hypothetical protein RTP6_007236 [Batrachochytrium dendrobatidis]
MNLNCRLNLSMDHVDTLYSQCRHCLSLAESTTVDDIQEAKNCLTRLATIHHHSPSQLWLAMNAWPSDPLCAIDYACKAIKQTPQAESCRMLANWLWDISTHSSIPIHDTIDSASDLAAILGYDYDEPEFVLLNPTHITNHNCRIISICHDAAMSYWAQAAEKFNDDASIQQLAIAMSSVNDSESAFKWWHRAAETGNKMAMTVLAHQYIADSSNSLQSDKSLVKSTNRTVQSNDDKSTLFSEHISTKSDSHQNKKYKDTENRLLEYVHMTADQGDPLCRRALGDAALGLLQLGQPTSSIVCHSPSEMEDSKTPLEWYFSAIESGDKISLLRAAMLLYFGTKRSPVDAIKAIEYFAASARETQEQPRLVQIAHLVRNGDTRSDLKANAEQAYEYFSESVTKDGCAESMRILGDLLMTGEGCKMDTRRGFELYERAVEQRDGMAMISMVRCLWLGIGIDKDRQRARETMRKAMMMFQQSDMNGMYGDRHVSISDGEVDAAIELIAIQ